ncbi:MAG: ferredoxin reductase, partial [Actinobacteria bacterium]|nr:ferredoxin reductase [Actinomycetota bacterium]
MARTSLLDRPLPPAVRRIAGSRLAHALTVPHGPSRFLESISPAWTLDERHAVVTRVHRETAHAITLTLRPGRWDGHRAGQHVVVGVEVEGVMQRRPYTITSSEHRRDGQLTITVARHPEGRLSRALHDRARPGLVVELSAPTGDVVLPTERPHELLLVSGGSGVTPTLSMVRTLLDEHHTGPVHVLHYATTPEDTIAAAGLQALARNHRGLHVTVVHTRQPVAGAALTGHLTAAHLDAVLGAEAAATPRTTHVCGPLALVDAVTDLFGRGVLAGDLLVETFVPRPRPTPTAGEDTWGELTCATSGTTIANDGRTILEQAEAAGLAPVAGCRMGICHTCVLPKR